MRVNLTLLTCLVLGVTKARDDHLNGLNVKIDKSQWVDLTDMGLVTIGENQDDSKSKALDVFEEKAVAPQGQCEAAHNVDDATLLFFQRHVKALTKRFELKSLEAKKFVGTVQLTQDDVKVLDKFAQPPGPMLTTTTVLADVDAVLDKLFHGFHLQDDVEDPTILLDVSVPDHYIPHEETILLIVGLAIVIPVIYIFKKNYFVVACVKTVGIIYLISCLWNWNYLIRKRKSKKMAELMSQPNPPVECSPDSMGWTAYIKSFVSSPSAKCAKYHEALTVNPLMEVPPTLAMVETFIQIILEPAGHLGQACGKFFGNLLAELSWISSLPVLLFMFLVILLMLMMIFKYKIKLPLGLGSFEPAQTSGEYLKLISQLQEERKRLQSRNDQLAEELQAVTEAHEAKIKALELDQEKPKAIIEVIGTTTETPKGEVPNRVDTEN